MFTVPAVPPEEPEISVPVSVIGDAAELLALVAELIDTAPDWMIASVRALADQADAILAFEGMACDRGLARYWRRPS
jgi:hypothetical protein